MPGGAGTTIGGRYVLSGEIAAGGMATVHLARQIGAAGFARTVAVKRLHERFARDPEFVAMFLDEARLVARIRHPNVVQTIDVVAEQNELFIVMEYVHGESLIRLLQTASKRNQPTPLPIAAGILAGMLHGLHEAHEARSETGEPLGIVHRDVSPQNVLVGIDGIARVLDFGVAKASERVQTTHEGQLKGKLSYMSPEQITSGPIDRRTDVYAAGVVLWETLTGAKLIHGANEGAVLQAILTKTAPAPSRLNPSVPAALDEVAARALASDPEQRFATARDMAIAIERAIPIATPSEIGAWVRATCGQTVDARYQLIAEIEAKSSSQNLQRAVDSLRHMSTPSMPLQTVPPPPAVPTFGSAPPARVASQHPSRSDGSSGAQVLPRAGGPGTSRIALAIALGVFAAMGIAGALVVVLAMRRSPPATAPIISATVVTTAPAASASPPAACPEGMVPIPGGRFFMGSDDDLANEKPAHNVTVRAFCMDRFEVSTDAYRACSDRGDCKRAGVANKWDGITAADAKTYDSVCNASTDARGTHPINCVDWSMADRFCRATGKRLPTEAEWEFAARGSDGRKYPWGDAKPSAKHLNACGPECTLWLTKHGTHHDGSLYTDDDGFATTAPVGSFPLGASRWGVEDIVGNVWEWVADWYGAYTGEDAVDPAGPESGKSRVVRGGSWNGAYADWVRPSFRFQFAPETRSHGVGFRCAK